MTVQALVAQVVDQAHRLMWEQRDQWANGLIQAHRDPTSDRITAPVVIIHAPDGTVYVEAAGQRHVWSSVQWQIE